MVLWPIFNQSTTLVSKTPLVHARVLLPTSDFHLHDDFTDQVPFRLFFSICQIIIQMMEGKSNIQNDWRKSHLEFKWTADKVRKCSNDPIKKARNSPNTRNWLNESVIIMNREISRDDDEACVLNWLRWWDRFYGYGWGLSAYFLL